jgi:hypothetical protein
MELIDACAIHPHQNHLIMLSPRMPHKPSSKPSHLTSFVIGIVLCVAVVSLVTYKLSSPAKVDHQVVQPVTKSLATSTRRERSVPFSTNTQQAPSRSLGHKNLTVSAARTPQIPPTQFPPDASETMKAFLQERDRLHHDQQKTLSQLTNATPEEQHLALEKWHEENAAALEAQQARAQQMSAENPVPRLHVPVTASIPPDATPELKNFLTQRHAFMKDQAEMMNQLENATPEQREQALENWHTQNASRLEAMQAAATQLSQSQALEEQPH